MIKSKSDLKFYLLCDKIACGYLNAPKWKLLSSRWRFHVFLRKTEYFHNCRKDFLGKIMYLVHLVILRHIGNKLGWSIPPNTFGPGLCIVHQGTVVVNNEVRAGANCRIHVCVNIGASGGQEAPQLGDNVYIAPGAKLFGDIRIGSHVAIGANAVVNKSFYEDGITIAGVPAKKISGKGSNDLIRDAVRVAKTLIGS